MRGGTLRRTAMSRPHFVVSCLARLSRARDFSGALATPARLAARATAAVASWTRFQFALAVAALRQSLKSHLPLLLLTKQGIRNAVVPRGLVGPSFLLWQTGRGLPRPVWARRGSPRAGCECGKAAPPVRRRATYTPIISFWGT